MPTVRRGVVTVLAVLAPCAALLASPAGASTPGADVRLSNDSPATSGYVSDYALVTGQAVPKDPVMAECSRARGRQNEPSVAIDPRNSAVVVGSSNDYCGTYDDGVDANGAPIPSGPVWLGYYRSQNGGASFQSSLVPGYPGDNTPYAARAQVRTAGSGDPVLAWDGEGRLFAGSESSGDPAGTAKTFGDVWVGTYENPAGPAGPTARDGLEFKRSVVVAHGSSAPNLLGVFHDKTSINADHTSPSNPTWGNVYFAWARFTAAKHSNIYFVRSTDHGVTFSGPMLVTTSENSIQDPDIAITRSGAVVLTWDSELAKPTATADTAVRYAVSTDGGVHFSRPATLTTYLSYDAQDIPAPSTTTAPTSEPAETGPDADAPTGTARNCGSLGSACQSGYQFFRRTSSPRSSADQTQGAGSLGDRVYVVFEPVIPGTEVPTGTTYGAVSPGVGGQSGVYALMLDLTTGSVTGPVLVDDPRAHGGHQLFADVVADAGAVHAMWWDSRNDTCYSAARPVGNCADRTVVPALDVYAGTLNPATLAGTGVTRVTDVTSMPNYEQFSGRTLPFAGDYLWIDSALGSTYAVWTDWRNTVAGVDPRETVPIADVLQCRTLVGGAWTGDTCPRAGGLDQDIYGDATP
jgi:hypothetical protein